MELRRWYDEVVATISTKDAQGERLMKLMKFIRDTRITDTEAGGTQLQLGVFFRYGIEKQQNIYYNKLHR